MRTLYLECAMGAAGDMLFAALLELLPDRQAFLDRMNRLGIPGVRLSAEPVTKYGILGTRMSVTVSGIPALSRNQGDGRENSCGCPDPEPCAQALGDLPKRECGKACGSPGNSTEIEGNAALVHPDGMNADHEHRMPKPERTHELKGHPHTSLQELEQVLSGIDLPPKVLADARAVYGLIAKAESQVHGMPADQVRFHEVGSMDALADIVGVCMLMDQLAPEQVLASPIHVGSGQVRCAHGMLPVPAPATALILRNIPIYGGAVRGELCTPTGAALLAHFASSFGDMPVMKVQKIGYGIGHKDFGAVSCVRALFGTREINGEEIIELCCNLDDMAPEAISFACERLLEGGALDVYTTPLAMGNNRSAVLLSCLCRAERRDEMLRLLFRHTSAQGAQEYRCRRYMPG